MTQEKRSEIYSIKRNGIKEMLQHCIYRCFTDAWDLIESSHELWIDKSLNMVEPFEGWCIFNGKAFTLQDYTDIECCKNYDLDAYLDEVLLTLGNDCDITTYISLEDYYKEDME